MVASDRIKVRTAFTLLVVLVGLCGCVHQYLMKLSNGDQMISSSKPKLHGTNYHFTDGTGAEYMIPQDRVAKIRAVSVVKEEKNPVPSPAPVKSKKTKHWYFLWLA
jgi:hypothetical protein